MTLLSRRRWFTVIRVTQALTPYGATETLTDAGVIRGWLDLATGTDLPTGTLNLAIVEESTHVLITDGLPCLISITDADRIRDDVGRIYHVTYVDDVTGVGDHLEVYLRYGE